MRENTSKTARSLVVRVVAVVAAVLLVGCGSSDAPVASPELTTPDDWAARSSATTTATPTNTAAPTIPPSRPVNTAITPATEVAAGTDPLTETVIDDFYDFQWEYWGMRVDPASPGDLAAVAAEPLLSALTDEAMVRSANNTTTGFFADTIFTTTVRSATLAGDTATLEVCQIDDSFETTTDTAGSVTITDPGVRSRVFTATLASHSSAWRVTSIDQRSETAGATTCA